MTFHLPIDPTGVAMSLTLAALLLGLAVESLLSASGRGVLASARASAGRRQAHVTVATTRQEPESPVRAGDIPRRDPGRGARRRGVGTGLVGIIGALWFAGGAVWAAVDFASFSTQELSADVKAATHADAVSCRTKTHACAVTVGGTTTSCPIDARRRGWRDGYDVTVTCPPGTSR